MKDNRSDLVEELKNDESVVLHFAKKIEVNIRSIYGLKKKFETQSLTNADKKDQRNNLSR